MAGAQGNGNGNGNGSQPVKSTPLVCSGHTRPIPSIHFSSLLPSPPGTSDPCYFVLSSCKDGLPMLRDWVGDWQGTFIGHKGAVWSARLNRQATRAVTGSADFSAKVWDTVDGRCLATLPHNHIVRTVDLNDAATHVLTGGHEKRLRIWDLAKVDAEGNGNDWDALEFKLAEGASRAHDGTIKSAIWDEKRNAVVSMGEDRVIRWWDLNTLELKDELVFADPITSMEKSHDGDSLAVTSGRQVQFISLETHKPYLQFTLKYSPSSASLHPIHQKTFVTGDTSMDGWVRVHDAATGEELECGKAHHGPVHSASYSPDGEMYATGSEDGTIRLWLTVPKSYGLWHFEELP